MDRRKGRRGPLYKEIANFLKFLLFNRLILRIIMAFSNKKEDIKVRRLLNEL